MHLYKDLIADEGPKNIPRISKAQVLKVLARLNLVCRVYNMGEVYLAVMDKFTQSVVNTNHRLPSTILPKTRR